MFPYSYWTPSQNAKGCAKFLHDKVSASLLRRPPLPRPMPEKYLIKSPPASLGPLENIKTGGEDPYWLSGPIAYVKT